MRNLDLNAYFQRIGYDDAPTPTFATLQAIVLRHARTIPFENLNPLLRRPVLLDLASLQQKLVRDGRGGYCFEHNWLLGHVLRELGFQVTHLAARVLWNMPEDTETPRSHMLLRIDLDGQAYLADVGFGGATPTCPLRLQADLEQATPHEPFRLVERNGELLMQAKLQGEWKPLYRFDLQPQLLADYEVSNWYVSTHPQSLFVTSLFVARPDVGRRYALRNTEVSVHHCDGQAEKRTLTSVDELRGALVDTFRITLPEGPELTIALQRILEEAGSGK
jgi:N-hydroxyarylamine O-acetyltransferase